MTVHSPRRPFQPDLDEAPLFARDSTPGNPFTRLVTAQVIAAVQRCTAHSVAERMWSTDRVVRAVLERATSTPAMTTVTGWAAELVHQVTAAALAALGPASAGADVLKAGLVLDYSGAGTISFPGFVAAAGNASFVAEGDPIPVRQLTAGPGTMPPHKIAVISVLTREMTESGNAEALITDAFVRSCGLTLDAVLFGSGAATAAQPAGLRNGVAALTASTSTDLYEAFFEDVSALVSAVSTVAANGSIYVVSSAGRGAAMSLRTPADEEGRIRFVSSSAVGNDVVAVAAAGLVSSLSPTPETEVANASTLVMDTAPGAAGTMGPERSVFQTDSLALKVRWPLTWALRSSQAVAWLTPTWK